MDSSPIPICTKLCLRKLAVGLGGFRSGEEGKFFNSIVLGHPCVSSD